MIERPDEKEMLYQLWYAVIGSNGGGIASQVRESRKDIEELKERVSAAIWNTVRVPTFVPCGDPITNPLPSSSPARCATKICPVAGDVQRIWVKSMAADSLHGAMIFGTRAVPSAMSTVWAAAAANDAPQKFSERAALIESLGLVAV